MGLIDDLTAATRQAATGLIDRAATEAQSAAGRAVDAAAQRIPGLNLNPTGPVATQSILKPAAQRSEPTGLSQDARPTAAASTLSRFVRPALLIGGAVLGLGLVVSLLRGKRKAKG